MTLQFRFSLQLFFEGVEAKVASGVKEEEIGYQLAYSKTELRKVIKEYPGKEVKKNLEQLYKKVDKQLCEEENLMQVSFHKGFRACYVVPVENLTCVSCQVTPCGSVSMENIMQISFHGDTPWVSIAVEVAGQFPWRTSAGPSQPLQVSLARPFMSLQVVWHNMQDEFLKQYQRFESLITRCYPGAGMSLEFTIDDLLAYFSDIAQSH